MWLPLENTFTRNSSYAAVQAGKYGNLRVLGGPLNFPFDSARDDLWVMGGPRSGQWDRDPTDLGAGMWRRGAALSREEFGKIFSTCWYTFEALTDMIESSSSPPPPMGLIELAVGGTKIAQWVERGVQDSKCVNATCCCSIDCTTQCPDFYHKDDLKDCPGNGAMYNAIVRPFVNFTVKGFLWYQVQCNAA